MNIMYDTADYLVVMKSPYGGHLKMRRDGFRYVVEYWLEDKHHIVLAGIPTKHDAIQFMMEECS